MSEIQQIADKLIEAQGVSGAINTLLIIAAQEDSPEGFAGFFEYLHGPPLHSEGEKWVANSYKAHNQNLGLVQECHRESGKTTVFSKFFLAFRIGQEPQKTNGIIRITEKKARETAAGVAAIIENDPRWKEIFPNVVPDYDRGWGKEGYFVKRTDMLYEEWQKIQTEQPDDPTFIGYGYESGSVLGSRFSGVIIVDDIHDAANTRSRTELEKVKVFATDTLEYCRMEGAWEIWNFTPWTLSDVYAYIKSTGEYIVSKSPVIIEAKEGEGEYWEEMPLNRDYPEAGNIPHSGRWWHRYDPTRWSWERLAQKYRKTGPIGFARMMLLDLEATRGMTLKDDWLHEFPRDEIGKSWRIYFGVDYAETQDRANAGDYFALSVGAVMPGGGLIAPIDGFRGHLTKGEALQKIAAFAGLYPRLALIGVESIGEGRGFYSDLVLMNDVMGRPLPLFPIKSHAKRKGERFEEWLAPRYQMGRILIPDVLGEFERHFKDEWLTYPNSTYDDVLDSVYMLALAAEGELVDRTTRSRGKMEREMQANNPFAGWGRRRR